MSGKSLRNFWSTWRVEEVNEHGTPIPDLNNEQNGSPIRRGRRAARGNTSELPESLVYKKLISKEGLGEFQVGDICLVKDTEDKLGIFLIADIKIDMLNKYMEVIGCNLINCEIIRYKTEEDIPVNELFLTDKIGPLHSTSNFIPIILMNKRHYAVKETFYNNANLDEWTYYYTQYATDNDYFIKYDIDDLRNNLKKTAGNGDRVIFKDVFHEIFQRKLESFSKMGNSDMDESEIVLRDSSNKKIKKTTTTKSRGSKKVSKGNPITELRVKTEEDETNNFLLNSPEKSTPPGLQDEVQSQTNGEESVQLGNIPDLQADEASANSNEGDLVDNVENLSMPNDIEEDENVDIEDTPMVNDIEEDENVDFGGDAHVDFADDTPSVENTGTPKENILLTGKDQEFKDQLLKFASTRKNRGIKYEESDSSESALESDNSDFEPRKKIKMQSPDKTKPVVLIPRNQIKINETGIFIPKKILKREPPTMIRTINRIKLTDAIKKYSKKHVGRSKKSHIPFSQRFSNVKKIPDLSHISDFHQLKVHKTRTTINQRFTSPRKKSAKQGEDGADGENPADYGVETIYSKLKNTLVSSALDKEQKQQKIKEMVHEDDEIEELIPGREDEYSRLFLSVYSSLESEEGTSVYVSGTPGVGKTLTIRQVVKDLYEPSMGGELPLFQYIEMNGLKFISSSDCYEVLWQNISGEHLTSAAALQSLEYYFKEVPKEKKRSTIVLLDEMDTLVNVKDQDVMYNFFNWPTYKNSKLIVIAVGNTMDLPEKCLSNKVSSRLGLTRIQFTGYTHIQLQNIIKLRLKNINNCWFYVNQNTGKAVLSTNEYAKDFLKNNKNYKRIKLSITNSAIEIVCRKIANVSGDARTALKICSRGIEIAEQEYLTKHGYDIYSLANNKSSKAGDNDADTSRNIFDESDHEQDQQGFDDFVMGNDADEPNEEVYEIEIHHVLRATKETNNNQLVEFIKTLSFAGKLILYSFVSLKDRNGLEEQAMGDIIDELKNIIDMNKSISKSKKYMDDITKLLYVVADGRPELRIIDWEYLINELIDANILVRNNLLNERSQMYRLNMSFEELKKCLNLFT